MVYVHLYVYVGACDTYAKGFEIICLLVIAGVTNTFQSRDVICSC